MDDPGYDSDGDLVLSLVPGLAEELSAAAAEAEADRSRAVSACHPSTTSMAAAFAAAAATQGDQQTADPDLLLLRRQLHQQQQPPTTTRPLSAYNRPDTSEALDPAPRAAAASVAPAPSSSFSLPSSAKVALEELRVSLDPRLVTHATGHALLPALAAAGIRARVGGSGGGKHSLRWRTVLFFRRRRRGMGAAPRRRAAAPRRDAGGEEEGDGGGEMGDSFEEEQVPFVLACLTAADLVRAVDAARSERGRETGSSSADFDPGAGLERLVRDASRAHSGCTLGVVVEGLESHCISRERADAARGARPGGMSSSSASTTPGQQQPCFVARRYDPRLLAASVALRHPAVRLALLPDASAVAEHVVGLSRALAEQPLRAAAASASVPSSSASHQQLLRTHGGGRRGDTQAARESLLLLETAGANGLPAASVALARALARVPGVGPAAAIAVAADHGSFGALMRFVGEAGAAGGGEGAGGGAPVTGSVSLLAELRTRARGAFAGAGAAAASGPRVGPAAARRIVAMLRAVDGGAAADW